MTVVPFLGLSDVVSGVLVLASAIVGAIGFVLYVRRLPNLNRVDHDEDWRIPDLDDERIEPPAPQVMDVSSIKGDSDSPFAP